MIPHSLDAVIEAVQALIDGRPVPEDWKAQPVQTAPDFSGTFFDVLQQAKELNMDKAQFDALTREEQTKILAEQLAKLSTKQVDTTPIQQAMAELKKNVAEIGDRVSMIEAAILTAKGAG